MSLKLVNICKDFNGRTVISRLTFELPSKGIVGISGPSGCGKTTLLRLLSGLDRPDGGRIEGHHDLDIGMVFQEDRLLPWLSALGNIAVVTKNLETAKEWLGKVHLSDFFDHYPAELSGGMKRRIALARALARPGGLLLLDEPFTGLDEDLKQSLFSLIQSAASDRPVVLVTHDREDLESLSDILYSATGPPLDLTANND